jgi:predicted nucleic acid-binding protein
MRIALDTNILAYAEGVGDDIRCNAAIHLIERLPGEKVLLKTLVGILHTMQSKKY